MKPLCKTPQLLCALLAFAALFLTARSQASEGDLYQSHLNASVVAHLPLSGAGATQMFLRQEGKTTYLYVQRASQQGFTVIDVTRPGHPKLVSRAPIESVTVMGSGLVVTDTPVKSAIAPHPSEAAYDAHFNSHGPEPVHVLNVSDPVHPQTPQTVNGVTSIVADGRRGVIYVANREGVWILSEKPVLRRPECNSSDAISNMPNCN
ncbi:MAG TPA: hypothetical protein VKR57_07445 [Terriglobales bacterium]|nr:hypothetical protein [Terriglobales bacterium]